MTGKSESDTIMSLQNVQAGSSAQDSLYDVLEGLDGEVDLMSYYSLLYNVSLPEMHVRTMLIRYVSPVFLLLASVANIISAVVMFRMARKVITTCSYLTVILMIDVAVLYINCGNAWIMEMTGYNIEFSAKLSGNSLCKLYPFVSNFLLHLSIWLFVAMAIETAIVALKPERLIRFCVRERAKAVVLLIIVLLVCVNAHSFWTIALIQEKPDAPHICSTRQGHVNEEFRRVVWPVVDILLTNMFPYLTIFSCTVIMITRRVRKRRGPVAEAIEFEIREDNVWKSYSLDGEAARQFHFTIIVLCIFYLVTMVTKLAMDILLFFMDPTSWDLVQFTFQLEAKKELAGAISDMLHYCCLSCKFIICFATSARFRRELKHLLTCHKPARSSRHQQQPHIKHDVRHHENNARCISNRTPNYAPRQPLAPVVKNGPVVVVPNHFDHHEHEPLTCTSNSTPKKQSKAYSITSV